MRKRASTAGLVLAAIAVIGILVLGIPVGETVSGSPLMEFNLPVTLILRTLVFRTNTPLPTRRIILTRIFPLTLVIGPTLSQPSATPTLPPTATGTTSATFTPTTAPTRTRVPFTFTPTFRAPVGTAVPKTCLTDQALAYVRNSGSPAKSDIVLRLLDSGSETIPTANLPGTAQHPRWSDDGCTLYFAYRKPGAGEKFHIWMLKGAQITQVSSSTSDDIWLMKNAQVTQLTASPTDDEVDPDSARGSKLVFAGEKGHLYSLDTLSPQNVTDLGVEGHQPAVSPDGNWVLYVDASGQLGAVSLQDGKQVSLGQQGQNPRWDPSGKGGYFTAPQPDGSMAVEQFTFNSGSPDLTVSPVDTASLDIAPDPDGTGQAVLVSGPLGKQQLQLVPAVSPLGQKTPITQPSDANDATTNSAPDLFSPTHVTPDMGAANAFFTSRAQN